jgi:hypothetical protein
MVWTTKELDFQQWARHFSFLHNCQPDFGAQPASYLVHTGNGLFPRCKVVRACIVSIYNNKLLEYQHLVSYLYTLLFNSSLAAIQAQVRRELEAEKKAAALAAKEASLPDVQPEQQDEPSSPYLAVTGVFFRCPMIG